jgi:hypothetical protein
MISHLDLTMYIIYNNVEQKKGKAIGDDMVFLPREVIATMAGRHLLVKNSEIHHACGLPAKRLSRYKGTLKSTQKASAVIWRHRNESHIYVVTNTLLDWATRCLVSRHQPR